MKIMVFLEGTVFRTRFPLFLFSSAGYVPIGNSVGIINKWISDGHNIILCSYVRENRRRFIERVLKAHKVNYGFLQLRHKNESYADVVERVIPDILIEDDCRSIGGEKEMCITNVRKDIKDKIISTVVPEFGGIDALCDLPERK